jgi:fucose permease
MSQLEQQSIVVTETHDWRPEMVLSLLLSYFVLFGLFVGVTGVLWAEIMRTLGIGPGIFGTAMLTTSVMAICILLFYGRLYTRFGAKPLMLVGLAIYASAMVVLANLVNFGVFIVALALLGVGISLVQGAMNSSVLDWEQVTQRNIMNLAHAMFSAGAIIGAFTAGAALGAGWTYSRLLYGLTLLIGLSLLSTLPVRYPPSQAGSATVASNSLRYLFSQRTLLTLAGIITFSTLFESVANTWSVIYLRQGLGTTAVIGGATFGLFNLAMFIGRLLNTPVVARKGARFSLLISGGGLALSSILLVATGNVLLAVIAFGLMGLAVAGVFPTVMSAAAKYTGGNSGEVTGAMMIVVCVAFMIGPPLIGWLAELISLQGALLVVGFFGLGMFWLSRQLPTQSPC